MPGVRRERGRRIWVCLIIDLMEGMRGFESAFDGFHGRLGGYE